MRSFQAIPTSRVFGVELACAVPTHNFSGITSCTYEQWLKDWQQLKPHLQPETEKQVTTPNAADQ